MTLPSRRGGDAEEVESAEHVFTDPELEAEREAAVGARGIGALSSQSTRATKAGQFSGIRRMRTRRRSGARRR